VSEARITDNHAGRSIDERLALALPTAALQAVQWAVARLPPGSLLRRRVLKRLLARGFEGPARDDYEFDLLLYEPYVEIHVHGQVARALGTAECYHGHQGFLDLWRDYKQDMDDLRVEPKQIIDLGDRFAIRADLVGRGRSSGVVTTQTLGFIYYWSGRGRVARQDIYWTWDEALAMLQQQE
jgi:hypothetical protein